MTISSSTRGWRALGVALAVLAFGLALIGLRGAGAAADVTAHASGAPKVEIEDFAFHPPTLRVGVGARVVFANRSNVTHTATQKSFNTGRIKPGKSVAITFKQKGAFAYHCSIHPSMHGKVIVD
jgi:plastocyanin